MTDRPTNARSRKLNHAVAIGVHNRHVGAFAGRVVLETIGARLETGQRDHRHQKRDLL